MSTLPVKIKKNKKKFSFQFFFNFFIFLLLKNITELYITSPQANKVWKQGTHRAVTFWSTTNQFTTASVSLCIALTNECTELGLTNISNGYFDEGLSPLPINNTPYQQYYVRYY